MISPMKALTIHQPYASLLAILAKLYETRGWATSYRGPIAIHAGKIDMMYGLPNYIQAAIANVLINVETESRAFYPTDRLPYGAVIATAELVGCWPIVEQARIEGMVSTGKIIKPEIPVSVHGNEYLFGDWTPGRFAWEFANMTLLPAPIPARGQQGLWNWKGVA